jgi:hypothetical protein
MPVGMNRVKEDFFVAMLCRFYCFSMVITVLMFEREDIHVPLHTHGDVERFVLHEVAGV